MRYSHSGIPHSYFDCGMSLEQLKPNFHYFHFLIMFHLAFSPFLPQSIINIVAFLDSIWIVFASMFNLSK